jgi:hypothetical protein
MSVYLFCGQVESEELRSFFNDLTLVRLHVLEPDELDVRVVPAVPATLEK